MAEVIFEPRYLLSSICDPDPMMLRDLILHPFRPGREFGEALIRYRGGTREATLILIADQQLGYYLNYDPAGETWLSLGNEGRLSEVICPDDWQVSAGLFVAPEKAWLAISEFCQTGRRSDEIRWIRPEEMPADGNW